MAGFDLSNVIHFLNVDLDVLSPSSLKALATAFGSAVSILYLGREGSLYGAHFEPTSSYQKDADALIQGFVSLVQKPPPRIRKLWDGARSREFNIGIQGAAQPRHHELRLHPATLEAASSVRGSVVDDVGPAIGEPSLKTRAVPRAASQGDKLTSEFAGRSRS